MLRGSLLKIIIAATMVLPTLTLVSPSASADTGSASAWTSGDTVKTSVSLPGSPSSQAPSTDGTTSTQGGSTSGGAQPTSVCTDVPGATVADQPPPPGAAPGQWETQICTSTINNTNSIGGSSWNTVWVANANTPPPPPPPPDPGTVAAQAENEMSLPSPVIDLNPTSYGIVNFPEWLWISPSIWHPFSTSATACNGGGCVTATATAIPQSVLFSTGDGESLRCNGPGVPYNTSGSAQSQSTYCSHTYTVSSLGQPSVDGNPNDDAFTITATITWSVSWSASGAASGSGSLGNLSTTASTTLRVEQIEAVLTGP